MKGPVFPHLDRLIADDRVLCTNHYKLFCSFLVDCIAALDVYMQKNQSLLILALQSVHLIMKPVIYERE